MEYVIEMVYIFASCLFVAGTLFFFPGGFGGLDEKISTGVGCRLYDVGSLVFALMSVYALAEMRYVQWYGIAKVSNKDRVSQWLYMLGSLVFLFGCLIWDPLLIDIFVGFELMNHDQWLALACAFFMVGSMFFAIAAFLNGMDIHHTHPQFKRYAFTITSTYEFGGLLFVAGTMGYVPVSIRNNKCPAVTEEESECIIVNSEILGCSMYLVGSLLYLFGSFLSLLKTIALNGVGKKQAKAAGTIQARFNEVRKYRQESAAASLIQGKLANKLQVWVAERQRREDDAAARVIQNIWKEHLESKERADAAQIIQEFWRNHPQGDANASSELQQILQDEQDEQDDMDSFWGALQSQANMLLQNLGWSALTPSRSPSAADLREPLVSTASASRA
jgi:hypothetical protein